MEQEAWGGFILLLLLVWLVWPWPIPGLDDLLGEPRVDYYSNASRADRIGVDDLQFAIGVMASPDDSMPVGIAFGAGYLAGWHGLRYREPEPLWRLQIGKEELEGRFVLRAGKFVEVGDAAE